MRDGSAILPSYSNSGRCRTVIRLPACAWICSSGSVVSRASCVPIQTRCLKHDRYAYGDLTSAKHQYYLSEMAAALTSGKSLALGAGVTNAYLALLRQIASRLASFRGQDCLQGRQVEEIFLLF